MIIDPDKFFYFSFRPIDFPLFYRTFHPKYRFPTDEFGQRVYDYWLESFIRKSNVFYQAQYVRHETIVMRRFKNDHNLPESVSHED